MRLRALLIILASPFSTGAAAATDEQKAVADRFVSAVKGEHAFVEDDFARKLSDTDRAVLSRVRDCSVKYINQPKVLLNSGKAEVVADELTIGLRCKGVPSKTPVGIGLKFGGDKIRTVTTHNFDLLG